MYTTKATSGTSPRPSAVSVPRRVGLVETAFRCFEAVAARSAVYDVSGFGSNIERVAKKRGCQVVKTYCGHGIGELFIRTNVPITKTKLWE